MTMGFKETLKLIPMLHKTSLVPLLLGDTGIGKTDLVHQYAASIGYHLIIIHMANMEPSDFIGLYQIINGRTTTCHPAWMPHSSDAFEVIDTGKAPLGYIIFLDEINRAQADMRQSMQQFILTKKIHTYEAPANTFIIAAANPADRYECYEFDAALTNKIATIDFCPTPEETMSYLKGKHGPNLFLTWLDSDRSALELNSDLTGEAQRLTPRVADNTAKLFIELEHESAAFQRKSLETVLPKLRAASFLSFLDEIKNINYIDVMNGVKAEKIKELLKNGRIDILSTIVSDLGKTLDNYEVGKTDLEKIIKGLDVNNKQALLNSADFLQNCPSELTTLFINLLGETFTKKTCVLNDPDFAQPLAEKLRGFKEVVAASKKPKKA